MLHFSSMAVHPYGEPLGHSWIIIEVHHMVRHPASVMSMHSVEYAPMLLPRMECYEANLGWFEGNSHDVQSSPCSNASVPSAWRSHVSSQCLTSKLHRGTNLKHPTHCVQCITNHGTASTENTLHCRRERISLPSCNSDGDRIANYAVSKPSNISCRSDGVRFGSQCYNAAACTLKAAGKPVAAAIV
jgi:hypothetical protein